MKINKKIGKVLIGQPDDKDFYPLPMYVTYNDFVKPLSPEGKLLLSQHHTMTTSLSRARSAVSLVAAGVAIHLANQEKEAQS